MIHEELSIHLSSDDENREYQGESYIENVKHSFESEKTYLKKKELDIKN